MQVVQCKSLLSLVLEDEPLVLNLLRTLQPVVDESTTPATKKARLDGSDLLHSDVVVSETKNLVQATKRAVVHCRQTPTIDPAR
jgi:hypothetical protein